MSKRINGRRANSSNIPVDQRAVIVDGGAGVKKRKGSFWAGFILAVIIVVAVVALAFFIVNSIVNSYFAKINVAGYDDDNIEVAEEIGNMFFYRDDVISNQVFHKYYDKALLNFAASSSDIKSDENVFNYAIFGVDKFDYSNDAGHADVIILASINKNTNKVTYVILEAKALVYIPNVDAVGALQDAYEWGGAALLSKTISHNFGIEINGYAEMDMQGCATIVDSVGGISIELSDADIASINTAIAAIKQVFDIEIDEVVKGEDGKVKLNGNQALAYIRGTSEDRSHAIVNVIKESTQNAIRGGFGGVKAYANALTDNASTSATKDDFASLFQMAFFSIKKANVEVIELGKDSKEKVVISSRFIYTYDYAEERANMIEALYE